MLSQISELSSHIRVDRYKYVCAAEGIRERKAMEMYKHFEILADGTRFEGTYVDGERDGLFAEHDKNGNKIAVGKYVNGQREEK